MSGLILAASIGFILGIPLMIFLVAGREEEDLLDRVQKVELSRTRPHRASGSEGEPASEEPEEGIPNHNA